MRDAQSPASLRAALQYLLANDFPSDHKAVLIGLLTQAMRDQDAAIVEQKHATIEEPWQTHETTQLQSLLEGKVANSWQHADELLMNTAARLHRQPRDVRVKATEMGLGEGIDFRIARERSRARQ